jgi:hypothetical protein
MLPCLGLIVCVIKRAVIVPRENDMVRLTVQVNDSDVKVDPTTGRIDRTKIQPEMIKQVSNAFERTTVW